MEDRRSGFANRAARQHGYSLLELLVAGTIVAVFLQATAGGSLHDLITRNKRQVAVQELMRLIQYSRSEAIHRQERVTLCALDASGMCAGNWSGRDVAVFVDRDGDQRVQPAEALQRSTWPQSRGELLWRAALRYPAVTFTPQGAALQNGSFVLCQHDGDRSADVVLSINRGGRPYINTTRRRSC
ncbi:MAG: GspH/FimT family pseudopilin [Halieaceae bacterium]|jgi:type IV fimbrial biogenesis protein FimT|nr:GspH/FimT family pseudopilin [Halieaceae bacterium]